MQSKNRKLFISIEKQIKNSFKSELITNLINELKEGVSHDITFLKKDKKEVRFSRAIALGSTSTIERGFLRFVELKEDGKTCWRTFLIKNLLV